MRFSRH